MQPDIIIPVLMGCALLWWLGRGMSWTLKLGVAAITLVIVVLVLVVERGIR